MYQVQAILDKKIDQATNQQLYLIKWKGYDETDSSWEPYQHLNNCRELLEKFQQDYGQMKTTVIGKVYIPEYKGEAKGNSILKPEGKSSKTIKIKKQPGREVKFQIKNQFQQRFNSASNKAKQSIEEISNKVERTPKRTLKETPQQEQIEKNMPSLNFNRQGSSRKKGSVTQVTALHRRASIDKWSQINSNFNVVNKKSISSKEAEQALNSHNKRQSQKYINNQRHPKNFTPIILSESSQNPLRSTRKNSSLRQIKQAGEQKKQNQKNTKKQTMMVEQKQKLDIIGMRKDKNNKYEFYVQIGGNRSWMAHEEIFENHSKELCKFYESNLALH